MIRLTSHSCSSRFFDTKPAFISAWIWLRRLSCLRSSSLISSVVSGKFGLVDVDVIGGLYLQRCEWDIYFRLFWPNCWTRRRKWIFCGGIFGAFSPIKRLSEFSGRNPDKSGQMRPTGRQSWWRCNTGIVRMKNLMNLWTFLKTIGSTSKCHKTNFPISSAFRPYSVHYLHGRRTIISRSIVTVRCIAPCKAHPTSARYDLTDSNEIII